MNGPSSGSGTPPLSTGARDPATAAPDDVDPGAETTPLSSGAPEPTSGAETTPLSSDPLEPAAGAPEPAPGSTPPGAKKRDYWWTVFATDPVAVPLVRLLARRRWLGPDEVTMLALAFGLSSGVLFSMGTRASLAAGGVVFYLAFLFDCVDGKLARALGVTSVRGKAIDELADGGRRASASFGLAVWVWRSDSLPNHDVLLVLGYAVLAYYFIEISGAAKGPMGTGIAGRWSAALAARRLLPNPGMPDVQAVVFIIGPITGYVIPALLVGIGMVSAAILLTVWRRLR